MGTLKARFRIVEYENRAGSVSWRVTGTKRDGTRVRDNFKTQEEAHLRQIELEGEYHTRHTETTLRATRLTDSQVGLAERAFAKLSYDDEILLAVDYWLRHGKHVAVKESKTIDEAVEKFTEWLDDKGEESGNGPCPLREYSRTGLRLRVGAFSNAMGNIHVSDVTSDMVENFLSKLKVSAVTRDNYRRAISRFFSWCIQRPRKWTQVNPCREIRIERGEKPPPAVLSVQQCKDLLTAAEKHKLGPYVAVCLFGGLRPFEASRLTWDAVNLKDREIRLEAMQTKTGQSRIVHICDTLHAWLTAHEGTEFFPSNWRKEFDAVKVAAGFGTPDEKKPKLQPWPVDVMRHTAISHYFRKTGSYGQTAEQFGNSEAIIKNHYQGRVSSEETEKFYALRPAKKAKRKAKSKAKK